MHGYIYTGHNIQGYINIVGYTHAAIIIVRGYTTQEDRITSPFLSHNGTSLHLGGQGTYVIRDQR